MTKKEFEKKLTGGECHNLIDSCYKYESKKSIIECSRNTPPNWNGQCVYQQRRDS